jgi:hypothetical protein
MSFDQIICIIIVFILLIMPYSKKESESSDEESSDSTKKCIGNKDGRIYAIQNQFERKRRGQYVNIIKDLTNLLPELEQFELDKLFKYMVTFQDLSLVKMLIESGANPHFDSEEVFIGSCMRLAPDIALYLINEHNFSPINTKALLWSILYKNKVVSKVLLEAGTPITDHVIMEVIKTKDPEYVKILTDHGIEPNVIFEYFLTHLVSNYDVNNLTSVSLLKDLSKYANEIDFPNVVKKVCTRCDEEVHGDEWIN